MDSLSKEKRADSVTSEKPSRSQFLATFEEVVTLENLLFAFECAAKGKYGRPSVQRYLQMLGMNLTRLQERLLNGTYKPRPCHQFEIFCTAGQKVRLISAPAFEDTIVQHLLYQLIYPRIDRCFIYDSYGCRRNKGTHKAADRIQHFMRKAPTGSYALQLDVRKYYYRINHEHLRRMLGRLVKDERVIDLMMLFAGDDGTTVGLNVGCLLSQLYGMIYLNEFDHYVKRVLGVKYYVRYVDDMVAILPTRAEAVALKDEAIEYLANIGLELSKWRLQPVTRGVNFAGMRTWPAHRLIRKRSLCNFNRALKKRNVTSLVSILGHAVHTSTCKYMLTRMAEELTPEPIGKLPDAIRWKLAEIQYPEMV